MVTYKSKAFIITFSFFLTVVTVWGFFQMSQGFADLKTFVILMAFQSLYVSSLVLVLIKHRLVSVFLRLCALVFASGSLVGAIVLFREGSPIAITLVLIGSFGMSVLGFLLVGRYVVRVDEATTSRA